MTEIFLDTSFVIALTVPGDAFHAIAVQWAEKLRKERALLVTSEPANYGTGTGRRRLAACSPGAEFRSLKGRKSGVTSEVCCDYQELPSIDRIPAAL